MRTPLLPPTDPLPRVHLLVRLSVRSMRQRDASPTPWLALHAHHTVARVAALLDPPQRRVRSAWLLVAAAVLAAVALAWAMHDTERFFEAAAPVAPPMTGGSTPDS